MTRTPIRVRDGLSVIEAALRSTFPDHHVRTGRLKDEGARVWYGAVSVDYDTPDAQELVEIQIRPDMYGPSNVFPTEQFEGDVYTKARAARSAYDVVSAR